MRFRAALFVVWLCSLPAFAERRAALLVGENAGDRADAPLQFAESDAAAMREALVDVGGVARRDTTLLRGATASDLRAALTNLAAREEREGWGSGDRVILYVSSHASGGELHLRGSRFPISELREFVDKSRAGLALLILDTCESGRALRSKGLIAAGPPEVQIERASITGRVVIASSGAEESAYESDDLGGSLFTQHFIAGLRGAADSSRDGSVTLQEAYAYAYARTVDSAVAARAARQTPVFDIDLQGDGELVLSEPAQGRARLALQLEPPGEWTLTSIDGGSQVARFIKPPGTALLAFNPGTYRLRARVGDHYEEGTVQLVDGQQALITDGDLSTWKVVPAGRKGAGAPSVIVAQGDVATGAVSGLGPLSGFGFEVRHSPDWNAPAGWPLLVARFSELFGKANEESLYEQETTLELGGGLEGRAGPFLIRLTAQGGALAVHQHGGFNGSVYAVEPRLDAEAGASWTFAGDWTLDLSANGGGLLVHTNLSRTVHPVIAAQGGLGWSW